MRAAPSRVIDVSDDSVAAAFCALLLQRCGLDVTRAVVASQIDALDDLVVRARFLDAGKRQVEAADIDEVEAMLANFEIVVQGTSRSSRLPFRPDEFVERFPDQLLVTLIPTADLNDELGMTKFQCYHASGLGHVTPRSLPGQPTDTLPPLRPRTHLLEMIAGYQAAIATLAMLLRPESGGNALTVSVVDAALPLLRRELVAFQFQGMVATRGERIWKVAPAGLVRCRDGLAFIDVVDNSQWSRLCVLINRPDLLGEPRLATSEARFEQPELLDAALEPWFRDMNVRAAIERCQEGGVPIAPLNGMDELAADPQLRARGFFETGSRIPKVPWTWLPVTTTGSSKPRRQRDESAPLTGLPLSGYRVVEFTHVWAGPLCGQILADLGADVVKVESRRRLDVHRQAGPYVTGHTGIDASGVWNSQNRGKRSCALDLSKPEGVDLALRLVASSDVVIENFSPDTLSHRGLGFDALRAANGHIVLASLSAFGQTGPMRKYLGYGPMMDAACGLMAMADYGDGVPRAVNGWAADVGGALNGALQIVAALYTHDEDSDPCWADVSEFECAVLFQFDDLVRSDPQSHTFGNPATQLDVCLESADDDRWIAVSVRGNDELQRLARMIGVTPDRDLAEAARAWAATGNRDDLLSALADVRIRACPVATTQDIMLGTNTRPNRFIETQCSGAGTMRTYGPSWWLAHSRGLNERGAPMLGEHTTEILAELAGLSRDEIANLVRQGVAS